jgi:parallel beta-helix repeat protein
MKTGKKTFTAITFLVIGIIINSNWFNTSSITLFNEKTKEEYQELTYTPRYRVQYSSHDPIRIESNSDFSTLGFCGSGTSGDPWLIQGYEITNSTAVSIDIEDTTDYFEIKCNYLSTEDWLFDVIRLSNVRNGKIVDNIIRNGKQGVFFDSSNFNQINGNVIYNNDWNGIQLTDSNNNTIDDNDVCDNGYNTSHISSSGFNSVIPFSIHQISGGNGMTFDPSDYNTITNNRIYNNSDSGIFIVNSDYNTIKYNCIDNNGYNTPSSGIKSFDSVFSIHQISGGNGMTFDPSHHNIVENNVISNNKNFGTSISTGSTYNQFYLNDFIDNTPPGVSQAHDNGTSNSFVQNYWNEVTGPNDTEIFDDPYDINGTAGSQDFNASVFSIAGITCPTAPQSLCSSSEICFSTTCTPPAGTSGFTISTLIVTLVVISALITKRKKGNQVK